MFKIGDEVWYFWSEWDGELKLEDVCLIKSIITKYNLKLYLDSQGSVYYKSKSMALKSLAKRMTEFSEDDYQLD